MHDDIRKQTPGDSQAKRHGNMRLQATPLPEAGAPMKASPQPQYTCSLPTGELVTWLQGGKYRLPDDTIAVAVAHRPPSK
ncbi:hypothetical protein [Achromobacter agilis]|uniref:Uncharacterized protein n=1 Tax=Achromobacter agilis TaxID=1353888 RepID=A0A446C4Z8_9BURK|nr:hypothetical protein [Achromobacter agilis]SSW62949.1 hypothetical protein AGI3411_00798 [Achromobacter agilis]